MSNRVQAILMMQEARGMMSKAIRILQEDIPHDAEDIREARAALRKAWEEAKTAPGHRTLTPARWLNQIDNAILAGAAGFSDILEAAAWLEGARA